MLISKYLKVLAIFNNKMCKNLIKIMNLNIINFTQNTEKQHFTCFLIQIFKLDFINRVEKYF